MKMFLLVISLLLMVAVIAIGIAGLVWFADSTLPTRTGAQLVLSLGTLAALTGLLVIWIGRPKPSH